MTDVSLKKRVGFVREVDLAKNKDDVGVPEDVVLVKLVDGMYRGGGKDGG